MSALLKLRAEYWATDDPARQSRALNAYAQVLADGGWVWPEDECWLPSRCPYRRYCTLFIENSQDAPCGIEDATVWGPSGESATG